MKSFINKANKKAYKQIRSIMNATNMLDVQQSINTALLNTFGLMDTGAMKYAMSNLPEYSQLTKSLGCHTYGENFGLLKSVRSFNYDTYASDVKKYLMSFIPVRMRDCQMYKNMLN